MPPASSTEGTTVMLPIAITVDVATVGLAVDELRAAADRRRKVAERASGELMREKRTGEVSDIRTGAVHVVKTLGEADDLRELADALAAAVGAKPERPDQPHLDIDLSRLDPANRVEPGPGDGTGDDVTDDDIDAARALLGLGPRDSTFDGDDDDDEPEASHVDDED